jgi:hypothetical protein
MRRSMCTAVLISALAAFPNAAPSAGLRDTARRLAAVADGPHSGVLDAALAAYDRALRLGVVSNPRLLTVIDYGRPSVEPRLWVLDVDAGTVVFRELVAHGRRSGENMATLFSNDADTHMTSLGLFVTDASYMGSNGYSLRLRGLDPGVNDNAYERAIVIHGASYVSPVVAKSLGRLGRSWGCPAVSLGVARPLIDRIKGGSVVYAHGPAAARHRKETAVDLS